MSQVVKTPGLDRDFVTKSWITWLTISNFQKHLDHFKAHVSWKIFFWVGYYTLVLFIVLDQLIFLFFACINNLYLPLDLKLYHWNYSKNIVFDYLVNLLIRNGSRLLAHFGLFILSYSWRPSIYISPLLTPLVIFLSLFLTGDEDYIVQVFFILLMIQNYLIIFPSIFPKDFIPFSFLSKFSNFYIFKVFKFFRRNFILFNIFYQLIK